ncbi:hypothetical protein [Streptomyces sp. NRRL F-5123]|uniref:hypothetical protein n=1 Tax=Streptomyces sp. NRRL F-5123 TaxID=1463856 RepID=UPI0004E156AC|nr:hypothetical protein [Streptomyces sp. NRRL F-5123]
MPRIRGRGQLSKAYSSTYAAESSTLSSTSTGEQSPVYAVQGPCPSSRAGRRPRRAGVLLRHAGARDDSRASRAIPRPRAAAPDDESHRGLTLVAALAVRHGVTPRPHGIGRTVRAWIDAAPGGVSG